MTVQSELRHMLETVAHALGDDLRDRLVFVGGCTIALFITDPVTLEEVRATDDVDLIMDLIGLGDWIELRQKLLERGFSESLDDDVVCRMRLGTLKVDFMPDNEVVIGFTNRWYALGLETAVSYPLTSKLRIKHLAPPILVATKLEAYLGRGRNDPLSSHDLEDVILVIDGREELVEEVRAASAHVRAFISKQLKAFQDHRDFDSFIEGNLRRNVGRSEIVRKRISAIIEAN
ncbi:MAG: hypothetical protein RLZZ157_1133 [Pseudomonadota bacterium]|jgi:predicted nucleotidyltransferase